MGVKVNVMLKSLLKPSRYFPRLRGIMQTRHDDESIYFCMMDNRDDLAGRSDFTGSARARHLRSTVTIWKQQAAARIMVYEASGRQWCYY